MDSDQAGTQRAIVAFDIDGVIRDVGGSYRRALADTVEQYTGGAFRPSPQEIDALKSEGCWNNDWEASQEFVYRYFEAQGKPRSQIDADYQTLVTFFQSRYRGTDPVNWNGYICDEPLLVKQEYFAVLTQAGIGWGFFSGATTASATYVLQRRVGLVEPVLVAMEDAPGKPDATGLMQTIAKLGGAAQTAVLYVGDTVADMYTIANAEKMDSNRKWVAVGILPPHVQDTEQHKADYAQTLYQAGAAIVFANIEELTPARILDLVSER